LGITLGVVSIIIFGISEGLTRSQQVIKTNESPATAFDKISTISTASDVSNLIYTSQHEQQR
jgi:hypothetical protein